MGAVLGRGIGGCLVALALTGCASLPGAARLETPGLGLSGSDGAEVASVGARPEAVHQGVAVVCGLDRAALGQPLSKSPQKGRAVYTIHDTDPSGSAPRAFHISGFADGCVRRVEAALVMFGSVELYELVRFSGLVAAPRAATDRAYAGIRKGPCGAAATPCTGRGLSTLARNTAFVQAFARKGAAEHLEILLHDGAVVATTRK